jgi:hypothetical protein
MNSFVVFQIARQIFSSNVRNLRCIADIVGPHARVGCNGRGHAAKPASSNGEFRGAASQERIPKPRYAVLDQMVMYRKTSVQWSAPFLRH